MRAIDTSDDSYNIVDGDGKLVFVMKREYGQTPNGDEIGNRWVVRDLEGKWIDMDKYRHDLFVRIGLPQ